VALKLGLDSALKAQAERALLPFAQAFQDSNGFTLLIVGELRTSERTEKTIDGGETVKVRLITLHPVTGEAAWHVRRATRAAWAARNMRGQVHEGGDLFADGQAIDLDPDAVEQLLGQWAWEEYSRLKVGAEYWLEALRKLGSLNPAQTSPDRYAADLKVIVDGLQAVLDASPEPPDAPDAPEYHALTVDVEDLAPMTPEQAKQRAEELIEEAQIVCGAVLSVALPNGIGFVVTCQRDEHEYGFDGDGHSGIGEDGELYVWPNPAPRSAADEPQAGGDE
jgi:hypothetical protein